MKHRFQSPDICENLCPSVAVLDSIHPRLVELAGKLNLNVQRPTPNAQRPTQSAISNRQSAILLADSRPRNSLGEYAPQTEQGPDPNAMAAAYGPPAVQPVNPVTEPHLERIKRFFGKRREATATD